MPTYTFDRLGRRRLKDSLAQASPMIDDLFLGKPERVDESIGRKVEVVYGDETVHYLVPSDAAWTAGTGAIRVNKAYRIIDEGEETEHMREITDPDDCPPKSFLLNHLPT